MTGMVTAQGEAQLKVIVRGPGDASLASPLRGVFIRQSQSDR
jgi:hypothetical protein